MRRMIRGSFPLLVMLKETLTGLSAEIVPRSIFCVSSDISGAFMRCPGVSWLKSSETMVNMDRPTVSASVSGMSEKSAVVIPHSVMRFESSVKASDTCSPGGTVSGATITFR